MHSSKSSLEKLSRADLTKHKLKSAFFELYRFEDIDRIKIKDITDLAGYNRGTFYVYYKDIYSLLKELQEDMLSIFERHITYQMQFFLEDNDKVLKLSDDDIDISQFQYFQVIKHDPRFKLKMKNILKNSIRAHFKIERVKPDSLFEYLLEYYIDANMNIVEYWIMNSSSTPNIGFASLLKMIDFVEKNGFHAALKEFKVQN